MAERNVIVIENDLDETVTKVSDHDETNEHVQVLGQLQVDSVVFLGHVERVVDEDESLPRVGDEADDDHDDDEDLLPVGLKVAVTAPAVPNDLVSQLRR